VTARAVQTPVIWFDEIDSTNAHAVARADTQGFDPPLWIAARRQTAGRGRRARSWSSPVGNLYATWLGPAPALAAGTPLHAVGLVVGIALARAARALSDAHTELKWPNDLMVGGAKAAGILVESGTARSARWLAIGVGVNLAEAPHLDHRRTARVIGRDGATIAPEAMLEMLDREWTDLSAQWVREGMAPIITEWMALGLAPGTPIEVDLGERRLVGAYAGLSAGGELLVRGADGVQTAVTAGEVGLLTAEAR
jgi:BirA family biotin operon repressor/biotin-[acetyl-CoA-carboxylase] ligase